MRKHGEDSLNMLFGGVNADINPEIIPGDKGVAMEALNVRSASVGDSGARKSINGEELIYENIDNSCFGDGQQLALSYKCIGNTIVNSHKFEVFADDDGIAPPIIRIDGKVVLKSLKLMFTTSNHLQMDIAENCDGGQVFVTDNNIPPMVFNVEDMMSNSGMLTGTSCTQKYFEDFNPSEYYLNLSSSMETMVFVEITESQVADHVFAPQENTVPPGMPPGMYSYSFRMSTISGDKTGWSPPTPMIPVPRALSTAFGPEFQSSRTRGSEANISAPTNYGIKLKMRVNNEQGYSFVEVRRASWNTGDIMGSPPIVELCGKFEILQDQLSVVEILDRNGFEETLTTEDVNEFMGAIAAAKSIRYYKNRIWLANVRSADRVITDEDFSIVGQENVIVLIMEKTGKSGMSDPYNFAYKKNYMSMEKYGNAVIFWDDHGNFSFPVPIPGAEVIEMPTRRTKMDQNSIDLSWSGYATAADNNGDIEATFECFDTVDCVRKSDFAAFHNILDTGSKSGPTINQQFIDAGVAPPDIPSEFFGNLFNGTNVMGQNLGFRPFRPTGSNDGGSSLAHNVNIAVENSADGSGSPVSAPYNPRGFGIDYFSKGLAFSGFSGWPSWAKGFSIVRTEAAGAVVGQGLAFYALRTAEGVFGQNTSKDPQKIWLHCPDLNIDSGINPTAYEDIAANPQNYEIVVQSPLGFFTEVFSFRTQGAFNKSEAADIVSYARIIKDNGSIDPLRNSSEGVGSDGNRYVAFGNWKRTSDQDQGIFADHQNSTITNPIQISAIDDQPEFRGRGYYVEITTNNPIFFHEFSGSCSAEDESCKRWLEPVYIVNIIRKGVTIPDQNVTTYIMQGQYQKFDSKIGIGTGAASSFELVSERWEDCVQYIQECIDPETNPYLSLERFLWVRKPGQQSKRWLDITNKSTPDRVLIMTSLQSNGVYTITDSSGSYDIYGVYKTHQVGRRVFIDFSVVNGSTDLVYQVPFNGDEIIVKYDNRIPVRIFGGDTSVGETMFSPIDIKYNNNANPDSIDFRMNVSFPNQSYSLNPRQFIVDNTFLVNKIQNENKFKFSTGETGNLTSTIRQLIVVFTCESRVALNFAYGDDQKESLRHFYPAKNYVMRPYKWATNLDFDNQNIQPTYWDEYGTGEFSVWGWGGFRFLQNINLDYSKSHKDYSISSVPDVGFVEKDRFCTRLRWSLERIANSQDTAGLRTFPELNYYDLMDKRGGIKFLWDDEDDNGNTLFALCERGVAKFIVDKRQIYDSGGEQVLTALSDSGITQSEFISDVGVPDELWRTAASGVIEDQQSTRSVLFFANKAGAYKIDNGAVISITEGYRSVLVDKFMSKIGPGYSTQISSYYMRRYKEYGITFSPSVRSGYDEKFVSVSSAGSMLAIVDGNRNPSIPDAVYDYGLYEENFDNSLIVISSDIPIESQYGVIIGGSSGMLSTIPVTIYVPYSSPNPVLVRHRALVNGDTVTMNVIINPGETYQFRPEFVVGGYPNPFSDRSVYYNSELITQGIQEDIFVPDKCNTLVYSEKINQWEGRNSYSFEKYMYSDTDVWGTKQLSTFILDRGFIINGSEIRTSVFIPVAPEQSVHKEFIFVKENCNLRPEEILFYYDKKDYYSGGYICKINGSDLNDRHGYHQFVPLNVDKRVQGRIVMKEIVHILAQESDLVFVDSVTTYKKLK